MIIRNVFKVLFFFRSLVAPVRQMLHRQSDRLSPLTLPVKNVQMLYREKVISKETLDEVNRLGDVLGDESTVYYSVWGSQQVLNNLPCKVRWDY